MLESMTLWNNLIGFDMAKQIMRMHIIDPLLCHHPLSNSKNFLFFGATGTGKTFFMNRIRSILARDVVFETVDCRFYSKDRFDDVFRKEEGIDRARPKIVYLKRVDEFEKHHHSDEHKKREFIQMVVNSPHYVIAETNDPFALSEDLLSVFDEKVYFPLPSMNDRETFLSTKLSYESNCVCDEELKSIAESTENYTYADLMALISSACEFGRMIKESELAINFNCFLNALNEVTSSCDEIDKLKFDDFYLQLL